MVSERDEEWTARKRELAILENKINEVPRNWTYRNRLLYYNIRVYIPNDEGLQTTGAKGCHHSQVAGHFRQEKNG